MLAYLAGNVGPAWGYVGPAWGYVGLAMWADLEASVGRAWGLCWPMLTHVEPKDPKKGNRKKHCKTQDILMVGGLSWGYVGPSWGYVGLSWGQCGPILELCWPILGLCWPILGVMLTHLRARLAHLKAYVGPCWPILSHKLRKMARNGKSRKHRKMREFLMVPGLRRQGRRPLFPTERREGLRQCHGQVRQAPGRI